MNAVDMGEGLRLRDIQGACDLCGAQCHPSAEICVAISCNRCDDGYSGIYHQHCVEKFLKKHGFESNRKTGFPCPKGRGKGTKYPEECKGRVEKSHPIIPKNEDKKKKAQAPPIHEVLAKQPKVKDAAKPAAKQAAKQAAKPPAMPRKVAPPKAYEVAATVLRNGAPIVRTTPPSSTANMWATASANHAIRQPGEPTLPQAAAAAPDADLDNSPHVPVGLVLEEALTKAQRKNLARRKKKVQAAAADTISEAGTAVTDTSSLDDFAVSQQPGATAGSSAAHHLLNGDKFVTDIKRYQQLLGLYMDSDSEDESDAESELSSEWAAPLASESPTASSSARPSSSASSHTAAAVPSSPATPEQDDDAALRVAVEQSMREYALQQEMQRQRDILTGYGEEQQQQPALAVAVVAAEPEPPAFSFPKAPVAPPPVVLPTFTVPVAEPVAPSFAAPYVKPESAPPHNGYNTGNSGYQQPLWQQQQTPAGYNAYTVAPPLAAGHAVSAVSAGGDEDDDLNSLLALCGVAG